MTTQFALGMLFVFFSAVFFVLSYSYIFKLILRKFDIDVTYSKALMIMSFVLIAAYAVFNAQVRFFPMVWERILIFYILIIIGVFVGRALLLSRLLKNKLWTLILSFLIVGIFFVRWLFVISDTLSDIFFLPFILIASTPFLFLLSVVPTFFLFNFLLKNQYQVSLLKSLDIYLIIFVIPVLTFSLIFPFSDDHSMYEQRAFNRYDTVYRVIPEVNADRNFVTYNTNVKAMIVGLPTEQVKVQDNIIYINDDQLKDINIYPSFEKDLSVTLGTDEYFIVGQEESDVDASHFGTVLYIFLLESKEHMKKNTFNQGYTYGSYLIKKYIW